MTKTQNLASLQASGQAKPFARATSKKQMILHCADAFRSVSAINFGVLYDVEFTPDDIVRAMSTKGTALEPVMKHLHTLGYDTPDDTVGSFLDITQITMDELDELVCHCNGGTISGTTGNRRFRTLANKQ